MLSCMETQLGMTVIGPEGEALRIQRTNPVFASCKKLLRDGLPAEMCWIRLHELLANPLSALVDWCERYGMRFKDGDGVLRLNDMHLPRERWLPLFQKAMATSCSPEFVLRLAMTLDKDLERALVSDECFNIEANSIAGVRTRLVRVAKLPETARPGDWVSGTLAGDTPFLVGYFDFGVADDGKLIAHKGTVLRKVLPSDDIDDVLAQPFIQGQNRTYRCEEGTSGGWLEDLSFDSLKEAIRNAKDIQSTGAEARIINRLTGEPVAWP